MAPSMFVALMATCLAAYTAPLESRRTTGAFIPAASSRPPAPYRRSPWTSRAYANRVQHRSSLRLATDHVNSGELKIQLEDAYKGDLVRLALKFGSMIESVDDIEEVHVAELDGDHMSLEVVYCDSGEQTCVAVAVPIKFPYHCDDDACVLGMIHELENMEEAVPAKDVQLPKKPIDPGLMATIARISVVMNRDFQDELSSILGAFGGPEIQPPIGTCEMSQLTPDGFVVRASQYPEKPVRIAFPRECLCAEDFQVQILSLSEQAMMRK